MRYQRKGLNLNPNIFLLHGNIAHIIYRMRGKSGFWGHLKGATFWEPPVSDTTLKCAESSKDTIFCKSKITWQFLDHLRVCLFPVRHYVCLSFDFCDFSLWAKLTTEHKKSLKSVKMLAVWRRYIQLCKNHFLTKSE